MSLPESRNLAQRLLDYEDVAGKNSGPTESAAFRVCAKLRPPLVTLAGVAGFRSLLSRALALARAEAPSLSVVQVAADGSLQGLDEREPQTNRQQAGDQAVILIARLLALLVTFIGEGVVLRVIQDIWPEATFNGHVLEKESNV